MIRELFDRFVTKHGVEPNFVDVTVVWNDTKIKHFFTIALFEFNEDKHEEIDDSVFFYCSDGIEGLERLERDGNEDFHIISDDYTYFYI